MKDTLGQNRSTFIVSFRLRPDRSFSGLRAQLNTKDDYEVTFHDDMVWIRFQAISDEWRRQHDEAIEGLRRILAILTIQADYPFELEPIQWIEDKPRGETGTPSFVLGRLGPDLTVRNDPPLVTSDHLRKGEIYAYLASLNAYYGYALVDYALALSLGRESIVFSARSVEWVQKYFDAMKRSLPAREGVPARKLMERELGLPGKHLTRFFRIANDTVIARHTGDPSRIRYPKVEEIKFCCFFCRQVLDRFAAHLWYSSSNDLPSKWRYPDDSGLPVEIFKSQNPSLSETLKRLLTGELS